MKNLQITPTTDYKLNAQIHIMKNEQRLQHTC